ncbi:MULTISPECIES: hypothetical protein [Vibrio]|uniref:hypothetical protein n=1 Tax=Vibrio TaxID=662 RepID=UPI001CDD68FD|nr:MULTISPECIES: hypothetical protein [Vibrio]MCA2490309.1 hypothetical protein [Vibrio alginolyticus]MDW1783250.1 hypothetical protein [Vibrio sp. Vb2134]MDW2087409.1 hypothetical protein [Vibrio sp. 2134-1]
MSSNNELQPWFLKFMLDWLLKALMVTVVAGLGFVVVGVIHQFGGAHPLTVFSIGALICLVFLVIDRFNSETTSKLQWVSLGVNVSLLAYSFLLLPTNEAIEILNKANVPQSFLDLLRHWYNT